MNPPWAKIQAAYKTPAGSAGGRSALSQIIQRIHRSAADADLEVAVHAGGAAGGTGLGHGLALVDLLSRRHHQTGVVGVVGLGAVVVGDDDQVAVAALVAGEGDGAAVGGLDGLAVHGVDIQAGVVAVAAENLPPAEIGVDAVAADGPQVGALGRGLGPLLGAHGLYGGGGLPEGGGVSDGAVPLVAVDIDHIGLNLGLTLLALGKDLGVALIHGIVLNLLHRAGMASV